MAFLGYKKSDSTLLYVQLDQKLFRDHDDSFSVRVAHNIGEAVSLAEAGFEYITGDYRMAAKSSENANNPNPLKSGRDLEKVHAFVVRVR